MDEQTQESITVILDHNAPRSTFLLGIALGGGDVIKYVKEMILNNRGCNTRGTSGGEVL